MHEVSVRYRRQNRQTAIDGSVGPTVFVWTARSKAGHGTAIDGSWGEQTITAEMHERRLGNGVATVAGTLGEGAITLDIAQHLSLGLDVTGTIGTDDVALRLDRPVGARRRIVHRQPQPEAALLIAWQNLGGSLTGKVTRPIDAVAATVVGLAAGALTNR
ncbi:MAG: hypothetical protein ACR2QE_13685 [Acidimicrobiales bacterium]